MIPFCFLQYTLYLHLSTYSTFLECIIYSKENRFFFSLNQIHYPFPFSPLVLQDEPLALAARFQTLSLYSIKYMDVVEAMSCEYFNPGLVAEEEGFMSPILFKFEDNDFCLFCLCFFLLHFIFCNSESDTILLFYSAALTFTANLHEWRKGCVFTISFILSGILLQWRF